MLCILYRIHKPRRSAVAELPPHLVRITSVHAKREWGFMKIKLFSCKTPPRTYARALAALATQGQLRDQSAPYSCLQLQGLSLSLSASRWEDGSCVAEQPLHLPATRRLLYSALRPCNTILLPFLSFLKIFYWNLKHSVRSLHLS